MKFFKFKKQDSHSSAGKSTEDKPTNEDGMVKNPDENQPKKEKTWLSSLVLQKKWLSRLLSFILALVITLPLFILLHRLLPYPDWRVPVDRIVLFIAVAACLYYLFRKIKYVMLSILVVFLAGMLVASLIGKYSFKDLATDYRGVIYSLADEDRSVKDIFTTKPFPKQKQILNAARITPKVKQYANKAANTNFKKSLKKHPQYRMYIQCFSVFKEVKGRWQYVNDPHKWDYFASADETLESFAGDCDDYAVMMAACLNAVGGTVRLVRNNDHIYPELKFSNRTDFDNVCYLIRNELFKKNIKKKNRINYHVGDDGSIWLNMDYTANYPGGAFHSSEVMAVLEIP